MAISAKGFSISLAIKDADKSNPLPRYISPLALAAMFGSVLLNACLYSCKAKFNTGVYLTCVLKILIGVLIKGKPFYQQGVLKIL